MQYQKIEILIRNFQKILIQFKIQEMSILSASCNLFSSVEMLYSG